MQKFILIVALLCGQLYAAHPVYTSDQIDSLNITYNTGLEMKELTGLSYEDTLTAIKLTESSAGAEVLGDQYIRGHKTELFKSSLGDMQIQIRTARYAMEKDEPLMKMLGEKYYYSTPKNTKFDYYYNKYTFISEKIEYYVKIVNNPKWYERKDKKGIDTMRWANAMLSKYERKFENYREYVKKDQALINLLLTDSVVSTMISFTYLKMSYEEARERGFSNIYFRSISRYNGGWNNKAYYKRVMKNLKEVRRLKKLGLIKAYSKKPEFIEYEEGYTEELAPGMIGSTSSF